MPALLTPNSLLASLRANSRCWANIALLLLFLATVPTATAQTVATVADGGQFGAFDLSTRQYTEVAGSISGGGVQQVTNLAYDGTSLFILERSSSTRLRTLSFSGVASASLGTVLANGSTDEFIGLSFGNGTLYTTARGNERLTTISRINAATTQPGVLNYPTGNVLSGKLAFVGSILYGTLDTNGNVANGLYSYNLATGAGNLLGNGAAASTYTDMIAFSNGSTLYGINGITLYQINTANGSLTNLGPISGANLPSSFVAAVVAPVPPSVSMAVAPSSVTEDGASNLVFTVTRSLNLASPTVVNIGTSGSATSGTDYTGGVATVTIPAGATTGTITINPSADSTIEPDETVILSVTAGSGYRVGTPSSATGTITNDDTISASPVYVTGSSGQFGYFNLSTRSYVQISSNSLGGALATGLAFRPTTGVMYVNKRISASSTALATINPATGVPTTIATYNYGGAATDTIGISFNAAGNLYNYNFGNEAIFSVNPTTAVGTQLTGGVRFASAPPLTGKVAFVGSTLFGTMSLTPATENGLFSFSLVNGAATFIGNGGVAATYTNMITFADNTTLYGIEGSTLYRIDTTNGALTNLGAITGANLPASFSGAVIGPTPNTPPTISNVADQSTNEDTATGAIAFTVGDTETAVAALTMSGSSSNTTLVPNANIVFGGSGANRTVTVTPAANLSGTSTITITVTDGNSVTASDTFVLTVNAVNDLPSFIAGGNRVHPSGTNTVQTVASWATAISDGDPDFTQALTFNASNNNNGLFTTQPSIATNGTLSYTPKGTSGVATVSVSLTDDATAGGPALTTAIQTFTITISANTPPTISDVTNQSTNEDTATSAIAFTVGDAETAIAALTVSGTSSNTTLVPNANIVFSGSGANRTVTVTPVANLSGTSTITVTVNDGTANTSDTFLLTVNAVNDLPSFVKGSDRSHPSGTNTAQTVAGWATAINDGDPDFTQALTFNVTNNNNALFTTQPSVAANGTLSYTPNGTSGIATVSVSLTDDATAGGAALTSAIQTFTITVNANTPPTISDVSNQTINEDAATPALAITVGDAETAVTALTMSGTSSNTTLVPNANIVFGGSGASRTVTVTPVANLSGTSTITITVNDGTVNTSDTFVLTVNAVNDLPSFIKGANQSHPSGTNAAQSVAAWATAISDGDADFVQALSFNVSNNNNALFTTQPSVAANGTLSYTPTGFSGTATVSVSLTDDATAGGAALTSAIQTFTITVNANTPPTISDVSNQTINEDAATPALAITVGDAETAVTALTMSGTSSNTTLVPNANIVFGGSGASRTVTVTPVANLSGTSTITVTVNDGTASTSDTFLLTVNAVNDMPSFIKGANQSHPSGTNTAQTVAAWATAINDGDADFVQAFSFNVSNNNNALFTTQPSVAANGTLSYTPTGFSGTATVSVSLTDDATAGGAALTSAIQTFTITVQAGSATIAIDDVTITEGDAGTSNAVFTVTRSNRFTAFTVPYAVVAGSAMVGSDFVATSGTLTFAEGPAESLTQTISVPVVGDLVPELTESATLTLGVVTNVTGITTIADGSGLLTITDNDFPSLSIDDVSIVEGNAGTSVLNFTVTRTGVASAAVGFSYATSDGTALTADSDYVAATGTGTIPSGGATGTTTISVTINSDAFFENNETFNVNLSAPTNAAISDGTGIGTITNDDIAPVLTINDQTVTEGNTGTVPMVFTITRTGLTKLPATAVYASADGTATAPSDYTAINGTATVAADTQNVATTTVTLLVNGDTTIEGNETVFLNLSAPGNATIGDNQGLGTITNDDGPPSFTPAGAITRQQGSPAAVATLGTVSDLTDPAGSLLVAITADSTVGVTTTGLTNTNGTVTANIAAACTATAGSLTVQVTDLGGLTGSNTVPINVTANTPPTLSYNNVNVGVGTSSSQNPSTGLSDNGSISSIAVQSAGTYTGGISVSNTGVISLNNATPAGTHTITVRATDNCGANTDATVQVTINQATTFKAVTTNVSPSRFGQNITLSAQLSGVDATGTVEFFAGATSLGSAPLVNSPSGGTSLKLASLSISTLPVGNSNITVVYAGDTNNAASTSAILLQTVQAADTKITVTPAANPALVGSSTINVQVQALAPGGGIPAGMVMLSAGVGNTCVVTLTAGTGSCVLNFATAGFAAITASYTPANGNHLASTATGALVITANPSSTDLRVRIGNGLRNIGAGQTVRYDIVVDNIGTQAAVGRLQVPLSADYSSATFSCITAGSANCGASTGTGSIDTEVSLAPGGVVIYSLVVTAPVNPERTITQSASITAKTPTTDIDLSNNEASDVDPMGLLSDGFEDQAIVE